MIGMAAPGEAVTPARGLGAGAETRRPRAARLGGFAIPVISIAAALLLWELISRFGLISETDLPSMSTSFQELWRQMQTAAFWKDFAYTVRGWGLGLLIATVLAVPLGIALGSSELAARAFRVPIEL